MTTRSHKKTSRKATHTPGPWAIHNVGKGYEIHPQDDEHGETIIADIVIGDSEDVDTSLANAKLIAAAPRLLKALEMSEQAIEEATDIMHYEDGLPVTALEGWEIERAYGALCNVLVEVHQAISAAKGEKP
jgi:hypothetical protein